MFVGHAESAPVLDKFFAPIVSPQAFAYRKKGATQSKKSSLQATARNIPQRREQPRSHAPKKPNSPIRPISQAVAIIGQEQPSWNVLEQAQQYADQGRLADAAALCERSLREQGASAHAYYLLGLVHDAGSESENAKECFNKAVYLEPNHYEALVQLALLAERQGETHNATMLRQRAQRAVLRRGKT